MTAPVVLSITVSILETQLNVETIPRYRAHPRPTMSRAPVTIQGSNHISHFVPTSPLTSSHAYPSRARSPTIQLIEHESNDPISRFVISHGLKEYHAHILRSVIGIHTREGLEECKRMTTSTLDAVMGGG